MKAIFLSTVIFLIGVNLNAQDIDLLMKEGIAFHDRGEYASAIEKYKQALKINPDFWNAHYELAYSYHSMKDYQNALVHADAAIHLSEGKQLLYPYIIKGSVLDDMGNTSEAVKFYKNALKDLPNEYLLLYNYAISCSRLGEFGEAEAALLKGLKNNSSHPGSHLQLALLTLNRNQKFSAAMGLYFFLMLENNTPRAKEQSANLKNLMYGSQQQSADSKKITISLPSDKNSKIGAAELMFSIIGISSSGIDKVLGDTTRSDQQKFVDDTKKLFSTLKELNNNTESKSKKKKKSNVDDDNFWWNFYVPFFTSLHEAGHTEAFCYHIMAASKNTQVTDWLLQNKEKLEFFYLWVNGR